MTNDTPTAFIKLSKPPNLIQQYLDGRNEQDEHMALPQPSHRIQPTASNESTNDGDEHQDEPTIQSTRLKETSASASKIIKSRKKKKGKKQNWRH